ncbi:membrane protein [Clostridium intestinale]|uniref:Membrane protein n=1 Tax=Clostridium intestinale URNW TaxID=1294142 RepID=U2PXR2_9CLOT|nr:membrane protein [Clostridium intestinale]ERK28564.1 membrane protein [Clostridium intestinale URNW]
MDKKYIYRKHLREPLKYLGAIVIFFILIFLTMFLSIGLNDKDDFIKIMGPLLIGIVGFVGFLILEFTLIYFVLFRRFKKVEVILTDEEIIYRYSKGEKRIPYSSIEKIKFPSIKYTGGWAKIIYTGGNIRLTVVLENIGDFIKTLKEELDRREMSDVYKEKKMYSFYKTATFSDQSWGRVYENIKKFIVITVGNCLISLVISLVFKDVEYMFSLLFAGIMLALVIFIIGELIIGRVIAKKANKDTFFVPDRDLYLEEKVYKYSAIVYSILYLVALILIVVV